MRFVYAIKRGKRALYRRARAHLAVEGFTGALCGAQTDMTSNVPWGLKTCKHCVRLAPRVQITVQPNRRSE